MSFEEEQREHPAAFLDSTLKGLRGALFPVVVLVFTSGSLTSAPFFALGAVALSTIAGYVGWRSRRWWISDSAIHLRSGVISPDETVVPLARISAVDETRGIAQRLFGVVAVHVQTAGGGADGELVLQAVTPATAAAVRERLGLTRATDAGLSEAPLAPAVTWRMTPGRLLLTAVTAPQLGVVGPLLGGAVAFVFETLDEDSASRLADLAPSDATGWVLVAAAALLATVGLSLAAALASFGGFAVQRQDDRLRLRRGVLEQRASSVRASRIHAVQIQESAIRRPLGLCSVRIEIAGYAAEEPVAKTLVPLCRRDEVEALLGRLLPELPLPSAVRAGRPPARSIPAYVLGPLWRAVLLAAVAAAVADGSGAPRAVWAAVPVAAALALVTGIARHRTAAWRLDDGVVAFTGRRVLAVHTTVARVGRLQSRGRRQAIAQRRRRLASVAFAVGSGHGAVVRHLDEPEADRLLAALQDRPQATA